MTQVVFIPWSGPSGNKSYAGKHWSKRRREAHAGHYHTKIAAKKAGLEAVPGAVELVFVPQVGKGGRRLDCSNYSYAAKIIEDGLVLAGILPGDEPWRVSAVSVAAPIRDRSAGPGMWVIIRSPQLGELAHEIVADELRP